MAKLCRCTTFINSNITMAMYTSTPVDGYMRGLGVDRWVNQASHELLMRKVFYL